MKTLVFSWRGKPAARQGCKESSPEWSEATLRVWLVLNAHPGGVRGLMLRQFFATLVVFANVSRINRWRDFTVRLHISLLVICGLLICSSAVAQQVVLKDSPAILDQ